MNVYDFTVAQQDGSQKSLSDYKGDVLLIVNTATGCGFTPQYEALETIYHDFKDQGFEVLDFPCNQFGHQAPGTDEEINQFCTLNYHTDFPRFAKIDVKGPDAEPLFTWLAGETTFDGFGKGPKALAVAAAAKAMDKDYKKNSDVKWNFTKFLIDREGNIVERFEPTASMDKVREVIENAL